MREAVVVSYARTGLAKATRGGFNNTPSVTMLGHAIEHAVKRSGVEPEAVEDSFAGCVQSGGGNLGRNSALLAVSPAATSRHEPRVRNSIANVVQASDARRPSASPAVLSRLSLALLLPAAFRRDGVSPC